jgi:hypothetical protein
MLERRKIKRRNLVFNLPLIDLECDEIIGNMIDLSQEGMCFLSEKQFEPGYILSLRVKLPDEINGNQMLDMYVRVIWVKPSMRKGWFQLGALILHSDIPLITTLIMKYSM